MIRRVLPISLVLVLALWLLLSCPIFVDQAEYVYVTQFGRHIATYDGRTDAGLHFKLPWPVQSVLRIDRRLQVFDVPTQELFVHDRGEKEEKSLTLTFDVYVCWRIADPKENYDPVDQFVRTFGTSDKAQNFLRSQIISRLKMGLGDVYLAQLVNTDPNKIETEKMLVGLRNDRYKLGPRESNEEPRSLVERAREMGIEIVDIRLRRFNHPIQVRDEIFAKIRVDRRREADKYINDGNLIAEDIRARGELQAKTIRAEADAYKTRKEGQARALAANILAEVVQLDPEFYRTIKLLESYRQMFGDGKTQLILSLDHPLLALFKGVPRMNSSSAGTPVPKPAIGKGPAPAGNTTERSNGKNASPTPAPGGPDR